MNYNKRKWPGKKEDYHRHDSDEEDQEVEDGFDVEDLVDLLKELLAECRKLSMRVDQVLTLKM